MGKHIAQNKAVNIAKGESFLPLDSDDYIVSNVLTLVPRKKCGYIILFHISVLHVFILMNFTIGVSSMQLRRLTIKSQAKRSKDWKKI